MKTKRIEIVQIKVVLLFFLIGCAWTPAYSSEDDPNSNGDFLRRTALYQQQVAELHSQNIVDQVKLFFRYERDTSDVLNIDFLFVSLLAVLYFCVFSEHGASTS